MKKRLLIVIGALMAIMNVNAQMKEQAAPAAEVIQQRGCRVGTPNPQFPLRRCPLLQGDETPYVGVRHQLVILASFQDRDFKEDHEAALATWDKIFNTKDYNEGQFVGSVHDYFYAQSYGSFDLVFDLMFVELPGKSQKYRSTTRTRSSWSMTSLMTCLHTTLTGASTTGTVTLL